MMMNIIFKRVKINWKYISVAIYLLYIVIGICVFTHYGVSTDETTERDTFFVNLNYILGLIGRQKINGIPDLLQYKDRFYGVAMQIPTLLFEVVCTRLGDILTLRHLYTFLVCAMGYAFFFDLIYKIFGSAKKALLGSLMLALYPRFFAQQFYNNKDMFFVTLCIICMWSIYVLIENNFRLMHVLLFSFLSALATNIRFVGIIFIAMICGYNILLLIFKKLNGLRFIVVTLTILFAYFGFIILMYPATWAHPLKNIFYIFSPDSYAVGWDGEIVFMGSVINKEGLKWYYIPVWLLISLPIWYLILFLGSVVCGIKKVIRCRTNTILEVEKTFFEYKYFFMALGVFVPWVAIAITHATVYNGWRHCFFLLPSLILIVLFGIEDMLRNKLGRVAIIILAAVGLCGQAYWIINNHPYEMVYLNDVGRKYGADFDRDYWHLSEKQALEWICSREEGEITVDSSGGLLSVYILNEEDEERIEVTDDNPMYFIDTFRGKVGNNVDRSGYEEVYTIQVDNFKVASILKRIDDGNKN